MSARRARRHPPRWFRHSERYVAGEGYRYELVIDDPRFPHWDVARVAAVLAVAIPLGVVSAFVIGCIVWLYVSTVVGS